MSVGGTAKSSENNVRVEPKIEDIKPMVVEERDISPPPRIKGTEDVKLKVIDVV